MRPEAPKDCPICPRLAAFRAANRIAYPTFFNGAVPSFGSEDARLLIVGLAPGLKGANRTGRPFTGDYAGELLYATLLEFGFASGNYGADPNDGLVLQGAMISNAVRCLPPANKPEPSEIKNCNAFLAARIAALPDVKAIVALGRIAHDATLSALALKKSNYAFGHGAEHDLGPRRLFDSYHCSRYNTNTRALTPEMFRAVFRSVRAFLDAGARPGEACPRT